MSLIEKNKFQVLKGGVPGNYEGCHDANLVIASGVTAVNGNIVAFDGSEYDLLTLTADEVRAFYMIIEGTDSYSGEFTGKAVVLRGNYRVQTQKFVSTSMAVGALVSVVAGELKVDAALPPVAEVIAYDAVEGTIVVDML